MVVTVSLVPVGVTAWTAEAARRIVRDLDAEGHPATHVYGFAPWPDHVNRRCVDFMLPRVSDVRWAGGYLVRWAEQLDVELIIANRRIWRSYRKGVWPARTWQPYLGRNPHRDHAHVQFKR